MKSASGRLAQLAPKLLFSVDGYRYGGKGFDRRETIARLQDEMPSLARTVVLPYLNPDPDLAPLRDAVRWNDLLATGGTAEAAVRLLRSLGVEVLAACFVIDLPDLGGRERLQGLGVPVRTLVSFPGH